MWFSIHVGQRSPTIRWRRSSPTRTTTRCARPYRSAAGGGIRKVKRENCGHRVHRFEGDLDLLLPQFARLDSVVGGESCDFRVTTHGGVHCSEETHHVSG